MKLLLWVLVINPQFILLGISRTKHLYIWQQVKDPGSAVNVSLTVTPRASTCKTRPARYVEERDRMSEVWTKPLRMLQFRFARRLPTELKGWGRMCKRWRRPIVSEPITSKSIRIEAGVRISFVARFPSQLSPCPLIARIFWAFPISFTGHLLLRGGEGREKSWTTVANEPRVQMSYIKLLGG